MDARAIEVTSAQAEERNGEYRVLVNGAPLLTPEGNPVEPPTMELAQALAAELEADGVADVTRPSLYAFYATQRDFIEPDPARTVQALVELLAHDYLLHPDLEPDRRQAELAAWRPQIELWQQLTAENPPFAGAITEPRIGASAYGAFRRAFIALLPAQLTVVIQAANLLKSVSLGLLLAQTAIDPDAALEAVWIKPSLHIRATADAMELLDENRDGWREIIERLLRYAALGQSA